jgi:hypothetical protein
MQPQVQTYIVEKKIVLEANNEVRYNISLSSSLSSVNHWNFKLFLFKLNLKLPHPDRIMDTQHLF